MAGLPDWVTQRLWSALLLILAYEGTRLLARALRFPAAASVVAGLVYALSPRLLGAVGVLSGEVLPSAVLPWAVLPLVLARTGRLSPRQAGLWSGVAVLCMSGVNAAGTLATLPLAAVVVLDQLRRPGGRVVAAWWAAAVTAACAWWMIPLLLLGRYSPPFLDFIETANATTSSTGWSNDLRGTEHWLAYYAIGDQPWWPGAHQIATGSALVLVGGLVAAMGLVGLCHARMPLRRALLASALLGLLFLTAGNAGMFGSLVDGPVRDLLDGPLAPFRNVHKVDPLVRLPLALGAAHAVTLLLRRLAPRRELRRGAVLAVAALVVVGGAPLLNGDLRMPGYRAVPEAWDQAADYLDRQADTRALVLPGSGFGLQTWGWTIDEPLQGVASSAWVTRSQVPLVPGPTARYLDTIEQRVASGEGGEGMADLLARGGITHVVLRRDLDLFVTETVPAGRAEQALVSSPGLERVAGFGSSGFGEQALIDIYRVDREVATVSLLDRDALARLHGAPDDVLTAIEAGVLQADRPVLITGDDPDEPGEGDGRRVVGDGYQRVERQFGRVHDAVSQVMSRDEPWQGDRRTHDFPNDAGIPWATAEYTAGIEVTAATSQGYTEELGAILPEHGPHAAVDGDPATEWRSGTLAPPEEQWLQVDLDEPAAGGGILSVQFRDRLQTAQVARAGVRFETERRTAESVYGVPRSGLLLVPLPDEPVTSVRVSVVEATGEDADFGRVVVSEVTIPGVDPGRSTVVPGELRRDDALALRLAPPRRACIDLGLGPTCDETQSRAGQDAGRLDRTVTVVERGEWDVSGSVVATPGPGSAALFEPVDGKATARAGSVLSGDPAVSGAFALDGNPDTAWLTASDVDRATLRITWPGRRVIRSLSIAGLVGEAVTPGSAMIRSGDVKRLVDLDFSERVEPFVARGRLRITFRRPEGFGYADRPMGVGEVEIGGLEGLASEPKWSGPTGAVCGLGPEVRVDGVRHRTEVAGTLDDVRLGRALSWSVCDGPVALTRGTHRIVVEATQQFQPVTLGWQPAAAPGPLVVDSERSMGVVRWDPTDRRVDVGPGDEAVLRVAENVNDGWEARLDGRRLAEVTIDGWQQGYRIPAGDGGEVTLVYRPDAVYRGGLLAGLLLALLLAGAAVVGQLRERRASRSRPPTPPDLVRRVGVGRLGRTATGAGLLVLGGPAAGAAYAVAALPRLPHRRLWPLGGILVAVSGVLAAVSDTTRFGSPGPAANVAAAVGAGLLVASGQRVDPGRPWVRGVPARRALAQLLHRAAMHWVLLTGLVLVAGQAVLRTVVASGSYYWQDDFLHLDLAETMGLSQDYLVRDYSGHLEVGSYAVFWLVNTFDNASFVPAVVILAGLQLVASCLLLVLLQQLFGRSPWVLVPFAGYLFSPLALVTATWLAAGLQTLPMQISMVVALIGLVRFSRAPRLRWAVVSWLGLALGLVFWQKAALVFPVLVGVEVLVLAGGLPVRERLARLRRAWWFWAVHLAVLAGYVVAYVTVTSSGSLGAPLERDVGAALRDMLLAMLLPGLFGGPWSAEGAANTVYSATSPSLQVMFVVLTLAIVAVSLVRRGRAALAGWVLVVGYIAADTVLLLLGRGGYLNLVARDPRYFTDALPVIVLGLCAAFSARPRQVAGAVPATTPDEPRRPRRQAVVALACMVGIATSCLITTVKLAPVTQHQASGDYARTVIAAIAADPGASVLFTPVPPQDVSAQVSLESLLRSLGREQRLDRPGAVPLLVGPSGALEAARLIDVDVDRAGPVTDCGWRIGPAPSPLVNLPHAGDAPRVLRLGYLSGAPGVLTLGVGGVEQAVEHVAGLGEVYVVVTGQSGPVVVSSDDGGLCVSDLQRGVAWSG